MTIVRRVQDGYTRMVHTSPLFVICSLVFVSCGTSTQPAASAQVEVILTGLQNPRGVGIDGEHGLFVAEAGSGNDPVDVTLRTGKLTRYVDMKRRWRFRRSRRSRAVVRASGELQRDERLRDGP